MKNGLFLTPTRVYDSGDGRFLQRDPMGVVDGMSLYNGWFILLRKYPTPYPFVRKYPTPYPLGRWLRYAIDATTQEVKDHVKRNLNILMPSGGFVFNTVHNIMPDVPPENLVAMFEAIDEFNG